MASAAKLVSRISTQITALNTHSSPGINDGLGTGNAAQNTAVQGKGSLAFRIMPMGNFFTTRPTNQTPVSMATIGSARYAPVFPLMVEVENAGAANDVVVVNSDWVHIPCDGIRVKPSVDSEMSNVAAQNWGIRGDFLIEFALNETALLTAPPYRPPRRSFLGVYGFGNTAPTLATDGVFVPEFVKAVRISIEASGAAGTIQKYLYDPSVGIWSPAGTIVTTATEIVFDEDVIMPSTQGGRYALTSGTIGTAGHMSFGIDY